MQIISPWLFFFFLLILFYLTLQYCIGFSIYQNESSPWLLSKNPKVLARSLRLYMLQQILWRHIKPYSGHTGLPSNPLRDAASLQDFRTHTSFCPNHCSPTSLHLSCFLSLSPYICACIHTFKSQLKYYLQRRQWQRTPVLLPGRSHGWRSLVGCSPWGR